jgi:hypothetical protein
MKKLEGGINIYQMFKVTLTHVIRISTTILAIRMSLRYHNDSFVVKHLT